MRVSIDGLTNLLCDNNYVVLDPVTPEYTISTQHNIIAYHQYREAQAIETVQVSKEEISTTLADILTILLARYRLRDFARKSL